VLPAQQGDLLVDDDAAHPFLEGAQDARFACARHIAARDDAAGDRHLVGIDARADRRCRDDFDFRQVDGGRFLAPKGAHIENELQAALPAIAQLGGRVVAIEPVELSELEPRTLVIIEKITSTPPQYPRAPGVPAKRPL